jgi:hypothetical protein
MAGSATPGEMLPQHADAKVGPPQELVHLDPVLGLRDRSLRPEQLLLPFFRSSSRRKMGLCSSRMDSWRLMISPCSSATCFA